MSSSVPAVRTSNVITITPQLETVGIGGGAIGTTAIPAVIPSRGGGRKVDQRRDRPVDRIDTEKPSAIVEVDHALVL